ncbi:MAG: protein kinase [Gemmataceae bacterium]|nr:protein kinase [Gemmataceae bacterium]
MPILDDSPLGDQADAYLAEYHEALVAGVAPVEEPTPFPPTVQAKLERAQRCLRRLEQVRGLSKAPAPPAAAGQVGRFRLIRELGRGGYGIVFLARDPLLRRDVALKVPRAEALLSPDLRQRFLREAQTAAALAHPAIVPIHEAGEVGQVCYIAYAYCAGPTLAAWLRGQTKPVPSRTAASLVADLADAMQHAHDRGVLHRDLKPSNILLSRPERKDQSQEPNSHATLLNARPSTLGSSLLSPQITDFGLAKLVEGQEPNTRSGAIVGTPAYMAPEQAEGRLGQVGPAADVYALGTILYEMLTGGPPFQAASPWETLNQVIHEEPVPPRRLQPRIPRDLETVCLTCLRKEPTRRYATAATLAEDLRRFIRGEPVRARPVSTPERAARWARRHPAWAMLLLTLITAAVVVPLGLFWHTVELQHAFDEAEVERSRAQMNEATALQAHYASDMHLAQQLLRAGDVFQMPSLLDRHVPASPADMDRRGFEWWYLDQFRPVSRAPFAASQDDTFFIAYGADADTLVTASRSDREQSVAVWDLRLGRPRLRAKLFRPGRLGVWVAVTPDGRTLAAITGERTVSLWDVATGKERGRLDHSGGVWAIDFSADGRTLAMTGAGPIALWDWAAGKQTRVVAGTGNRSEALVLCPDGETAMTRPLFAAGLPLLDLTTGSSRPPLADGHRSVSSLARTPGGTLLTFLQDHKQLVGHTSATRHFVLWWNAPSSAVLRAAAVSPDERTAVVGDASGRLYYVDVATGKLRRSLRWQARDISSLAYSRDGRWLAVATEDGQVYQLSTEFPAFAGTLETTVALGPVAFSPDSQTVAVADRGGRVRLLDAHNAEVRTSLGPHARDVVALAWSSDSRVLATLDRGTPGATLWDVATGRLLRRLGDRSTVTLSRLRFSPCGRLLLAGDNEGFLRGWDYSTGKELETTRGATAHVSGLEFSADGMTLATAFGNGTIRIWKVVDDRLQPLPEGTAKTPYEVTAVAIAPDGKSLATGELAGNVRLWTFTEQGLRETASLQGLVAVAPEAGVRSLAFSADGQLLLVAGMDQRLRLWDVGRRRIRHEALGASLGWWRAGVLSPDGQRMATTNAGGGAELWDLNRWAVVSPPHSPFRPIRSLAFLPDRRTLATGAEANGHPVESSKRPLGSLPLLDREVRYALLTLHHPADSVRLWDHATGAEQPTLSGTVNMTSPSLVAACPRGRILAGGSNDGSIWLWELSRREVAARKFVSRQAENYANSIEAMRRLAPARPLYPEAVQSLAFSSDGSVLLATSNRGAVTAWNTADWTQRPPLPGDFTGTCWIGWVPASRVAVLGRGGQLEFWDLDGRTLTKTLGRSDDATILCGSFSADGGLLAVATADRRIRLWDVKAERERAPFIGHSDRITSIVFSPDGKTLASSSRDETVRLWSVAAGQEVSTLAGHQGIIHCLAFSPDGQTLVSGGEASPGVGEVLIWRTSRH